MSSTHLMLVLVPSLPLAAALVTAVLGPRVLRTRAHWPALLATPAALVLSVLLLWHVQRQLQRPLAPDATAAASLQASGTDGLLAGSGTSPRAAGYEETVTLWSWAVIPEARAAVAPADGTTAANGTRAGDGTTAGDDTTAADGTTAVDGAATPAEEPAATAFRIAVTLRLDPLTAIMFVTVTLIASLVVWYSSAYMHGDRGYWRFFAYVSLFVFSMLMLVCVSNFLLLYVFWEAVGVCSYLLIGFWYHKPEAAAAGQKAFLVNRVGDFGFALGVFLLWSALGTLDFHDTTSADGSLAPGILGQAVVAQGYGAAFPGVTTGMLAAAALLLFLGACGKSAQVPLHVWLPDAMEGPTPVSALIHAATMVTAGVYLVARCTPLFAAGSGAHAVVACIGGLTALLAGVVALTQTDLKRILAYSTVSQLGYMFLALGTGSLAGIVAAMFHLFTHAFFKACLFLGAGSVMHAMGGVIDIRQFGGLRRLLPVTHATFLVASLALAGVAPLSGFWSKDAILGAVHDAARHGTGGGSWLFAVLYWSALFSAFLTAVYSFRALFRTFYGPQRVPPEAAHHAHESPLTMTVPLLLLAAGSAAIAVVAPGFRDFLAGTPSLGSAGGAREAASAGTFHWDVALWSTAAALLGIGLAALLYLRPSPLLLQLTALMRRLGLYQASAGKLFFDAVYTACITWPLIILAYLCYFIDKIVIDGLVNLLGWIPRAIGSMLRPMQMGLIPFYALAMILGMLVLIGSLLRWPSG